MNQDAILEEIVRRLVSAFHPRAIYLFGSKARGESDENSDYDILMVVDRSDMPMYKRAQDAFQILWGVGAAKDVLVYTEAEFQRKCSVVTSLPATVLREGRLLYAA